MFAMKLSYAVQFCLLFFYCNCAHGYSGEESQVHGLETSPKTSPALVNRPQVGDEGDSAESRRGARMIVLPKLYRISNQLNVRTEDQCKNNGDKTGALVDLECYEFFAETKNFEDARMHCMDRGGDLWTPNFMDTFLLQKVFTKIPNVPLLAEDDQVWIGVTGNQNDGFTTVDGQGVTNELLIAASDDDANEGSGCALFDFTEGGFTKLNSGCVAIERSFLCEYPTQAETRYQFPKFLEFRLGSPPSNRFAIPSMLRPVQSSPFPVFPPFRAQRSGRFVEPLVSYVSSKAEAVHNAYLAAWIKRQCDEKEGKILDGKCYKYFESAITFDDAVEQCRSMGGQLWMPNTKDTFLYNKVFTLFMEAATAPNSNLWIGVKISGPRAYTLNGDDVTDDYLIRLGFEGGEGCFVLDFEKGAFTSFTQDCDENENAFFCEFSFEQKK